jgi:streptomycin 6-kinase
MTVPEGCAARIAAVHGATGERWLEELPALLVACAQRWSLTVREPFDHLSYHYVAPAVAADGSRVVLKAGVPSAGLACEMAALREFAGSGMVRLLDGDAEMGVMILEQVQPGTPLTSLGDDEAVIRQAVRLMQRLWKPVGPAHTFATVGGWAEEFQRLRAQFDGGAGPFPPLLVEQAERLFQQAAREGALTLLLHGDMHPRNILAGEREPWLAIDPKGVVGDPLYDVACLINSVPPLPDKRLVRQMMARRADLLAELLSLPRERILRWALADAVLAAWWDYEDGGEGWAWMVTMAAIHLSLM